MRSERAALLADVPHARGVYVLRDGRGRPLYVGASGDLRTRVASHLGDRKDRLPGRDSMARDVRSVTVRLTGGPLETLLLEASLIRRHLPPYNRSIRNHDRYAYLSFRRERFPRLAVTAGSDGSPAERYGPWRKAHRAGRVATGLRRAFGLRPCRLALEQRSLFVVCERAGAESCAAPCDASRPEEDYDRRLAAARAFLEGRDDGGALAIEDEELRETLRQAFSMLSGLRAAVTAPDELLRLPAVGDGPRRIVLVRAGRPFGPLPLPPDEEGVARTLRHLLRLPPPAAYPIARREADDIKILAAHRDAVPAADRFDLDVAPRALMA